MNNGQNDNKTILIFAHEAGGIPDGLAKGFCKLHCDCKLVVYNKQIVEKKHSLLDRIIHRLLDPGYENDVRMSFNKSIDYYKPFVVTGNSSAIIIMKGNRLNLKNRDVLLGRNNLPLITYLYDPLHECSMQKDCAEISDFIICVDNLDTLTFPNKSIWLPLGYDDEVYFPGNKEKDIDIFISGALGKKYTKRKEVIEELGKSSLAKKYKICLVGSTGFSLRDWRVKIGNINWIAKRVTPSILADFQRRAKVCINIHRDDSDFIVNPSFFSIPGSGSCQFAERKESLARFLKPEEEYVSFKSKDELIEKLSYFLTNEEERNNISLNGYNRVKREHTLFERAKIILEIIKSLNQGKN